MKIFKRILPAILIAAAWIPLLCIVASAEKSGAKAYKVENSENGFTATHTETVAYATLGELISELEGEGVSFEFVNVSSDTGFSVTENVVLSGSLDVGGNVVILSDAVLDGITLKLSGASLSVRGKYVRLTDARITGTDKPAISVERSARSYLYAENSVITAESSSAALSLAEGCAELVDTAISNSYGAAVRSSGTLMLGGKTALTGNGYGVVSTRPIVANAGGSPLRAPLSVSFAESFEKGTFREVILGADKGSAEGIRVYDRDGNSVDTKWFDMDARSEEKNFLAVYMPYRVKFYCGNELFATHEYVEGETVVPPDDPSRTGFSFVGWCSDASLGEGYTFGSSPNSDVSLYASFDLLEPSFSVSSLSFVYNGEERKLCLESLSHPLDEYGEFSFVWYKDGEMIDSAGGEVCVRNVADSGAYKCVIGFSLGADAVFVSTPEVCVSIEPKPIPIPKSEKREYTGEKISAVFDTSPYYTFDACSFTDAGEYPVRFTLSDPENCVWEEGGSDSAEVMFKILPAENVFISPPEVGRGYTGRAPTVIVSVRFGAPRFYTSADGEKYTEGFPSEVGRYFLKIAVDGTGNYSSLESEPIEFEIAPELAVGLVIQAPPSVTSYLAFDKVCLDGAVIAVTYNSGRKEILDNSLIEVSYGKGDSLLVGDRCVNLIYQSASAPLSVSVSARSYDISSLTVGELNTVYNGKHTTLSVSGNVVGEDGISLNYTVRGGGTDAGSYTVSVEFSTESANYLLPQSLSYTLTIAPVPIEIEFGEKEFVYDGRPKVPVAELVLVTGQRVRAEVLGAAVDAGKYTATAFYNDGNYTLTDNKCEFEIKKAVIDLSFAKWQGGEFVYDGGAHSVSLTGLPQEVKLVGYADATFTDAGRYKAVAALSYDERNYIIEEPLSYEWEIRPAVYELGDFRFADNEAVYDGGVHYPITIGVLPKGADGTSPSYTFSRGATDVADGRVTVEITFSSRSKNYMPPDSLTACVSIIPKKITVEWSELRVAYNGEYRVPRVTAECEVEVIGRGLNAGEYTVIASSLDPNYSIANEKEVLIIEKCENSWLKSVGMLNYFTSGNPSPMGEAKGGETKFLFYSDKELLNKIDTPYLPGTYYMIAYAPESENYLELRSKAIEFKVVAVEPVCLKVNLKTTELTAMYRLSDKDVVAYYENNDGSQTLIAFSDLSVTYQSADSIRFGDSGIVFSSGGFEYSEKIFVSRAVYDMSAVHWEGEYHVYDGKEKSAYLTGLPEGITLIEYSVNSAVESGSYKLSAVLGYDMENYYPPKLPDAWLVIRPAKVEVPKIEDLRYNGRAQLPTVEESPLYTFSASAEKNAGEYTVVFTLNDPDNYEFSSASEVKYRILPIKLVAELNRRGDGYVLTEGELLEGDSLCEEYYREDGMVYLRSSNPNYDLIADPVKASGGAWILIAITGSIILLLAVCVLLINRKKVILATPSAKNKKRSAGRTGVAAPPERAPKLERLLAVDVAHADGMISDSMAKSLLMDSDLTVKTDGRGRATVNVDKLSEAFGAGDTVDINSMKQKGLIGKDVSYVKVLAGGVIDKALTVRANSFSRAAVKMIALTGGRAYKTKSARRKNKK